MSLASFVPHVREIHPYRRVELDDFLKINLFISLFLAALGLRCCVRAFSSCGERGLLCSCDARASHCGGFSYCGARAVGVRASVVVARGL